jgi:cyclohexanecarboxylate-CoA ligase
MTTAAGPGPTPAPTPGRRPVDPEVAADYRRRGWWRDATAVDDFVARAAERPDAVAVVSHHRDRPVERHTYRELERLSRRFAGALIDLGVQRGDVVSVQLPNSWEFPALVYGILRAGAVVNPLVPIFRQRELAFILGRTASKVLLVPDVHRGHDHAAMGLDLLGELDSLAHLVVVGEAAGGAIGFAEHFVDRRWEDDPGLAAELEARRPVADDLVEIQFTSGTTGEPKGVLHSHNTVFSGGRPVPEVLGLTDTDVCFMASTLAHQTGFCYGLLQPLGMGMKVVYQDLWDPAAMIRIVDEEGVSWTVGATAFAMDMIAAQRQAPGSLATFRAFVCGGAPIPPKVVLEARDVLGAELVAVWGMTENMIVTTTRPGDSAELVGDSDGVPVDWMEVRIVDDAGAEVPVDGVGHLQVRGPSQALGYFARPDLYEAASTPDGWFDTGDLARRRADGGIRIAGRTKDLVIRGGENIPVVEVENVLYTYPGLVDVAVIGLPDDRLGERACAVVVTEGPPPALAELTAFLEAKGVAKQFWPERLEVVAEMPKTPSGKIQKFELRTRFG